ncbi:unnamed protein product [Lactuca virosa]|uniref:Uncharacterized protein n=1 Tax=Lactuca virosa TaxID=75947 RepID=A0AAU9NEW8_9ASTR|nr:unnamed protein product [Lactuca virosa]
MLCFQETTVILMMEKNPCTFHMLEQHLEGIFWNFIRLNSFAKFLKKGPVQSTQERKNMNRKMLEKEKGNEGMLEKKIRVILHKEQNQWRLIQAQQLCLPLSLTLM